MSSRSQQPETPVHRGPVSRSGVALLALALLAGCAMSRPPATLGPLEPLVTAYARHPVACAPTTVGNVVGGVAGYPVGLALGFATWPILWALPDRAADATLRVYFYTLPYLGGFVTGTPFVPVALLFDERPCEFGFLR